MQPWAGWCDIDVFLAVGKLCTQFISIVVVLGRNLTKWQLST